MTTFEHSLDRLHRLSDWANPILVKETRQALKSRQFVVAFMLMLAASWFIFVLGVMLGGSAIQFGAIGTQFFQFFYWVLAVAVMVVVPFGAYRSLLAEKDQATYDLLSITALTPRQIVWGKLLSALLQVLIFYSAIAPFIAFTSLLQGFDFVQVAFVLGGTLLISLLISMAAIAISALTKQRQWQAFTSIFVLGMLVWSLGLLAGLQALAQEVNFAEPAWWWVIGMCLAAGGSYFLLLQKIAQAQLTFESDDRTSGIRLICSAQFLLAWGGLIAFAWFGSSISLDEDLLVTALVLSLLHLTVVGLMAVTEDSFLSRRIRRNLPARAARRLLYVPLLQGGARGYLYLLIHVVLLVLVGLLCITTFLMDAWIRDFLIASCCYLTAYLGLACLLGRWTQSLSSDIRPGHARVLTLIVLGIGCIAPYVPWLWGHRFEYGYSLLMITNPFATIDHVTGRSAGYYEGAIWPMLYLGGAVAVLVNLRAMFAGAEEVIFADVRPRTPESASAPAASAAEAEQTGGGLEAPMVSGTPVVDDGQ